MDLKAKLSVDCWCQAGQFVQITDEKKCEKECQEKGCLFVCPVGLFELKNDGVVFDGNGVCLECGACRLVCDNISFEYPPAGKGISNQFG